MSNPNDACPYCEGENHACPTCQSVNELYRTTPHAREEIWGCFHAMYAEKIHRTLLDALAAVDALALPEKAAESTPASPPRPRRMTDGLCHRPRRLDGR